MTRDEWTDGRIAEAVGRLEKAIEQKASQETYNNLKEDVDELKKEVKEIVNRSVTKQLIIVSSPLFFASLTVILGIFTGRIS
jgi:hypothetical protein